jgi:cholestenol Delta-isomerase
MPLHEAMTPYYPEGLTLPGYTDLVLHPLVIHGTFFGVAAVLLALGGLFTRMLAPIERSMAVWLLISGVIHLVVEGSFALNDTFYTNADPKMLLLELWKEYAKADSRYATRDAFVTTMETFTAFVLGPLCLVCVIGLMRATSWRWVLIMLVSCCQLYGTILYFATSWFENNAHVRPEPLYVWFYFIAMNTMWIVAPMLCIWNSPYRFEQRNSYDQG